MSTRTNPVAEHVPLGTALTRQQRRVRTSCQTQIPSLLDP